MSKLQKDLLIVGAGVAAACGGYYMYTQSQEGNNDNPTTLSQETLDAAKKAKDDLSTLSKSTMDAAKKAKDDIAAKVEKDGWPSKLDKKDDPSSKVQKKDDPSSK